MVDLAVPIDSSPRDLVRRRLFDCSLARSWLECVMRLSLAVPAAGLQARVELLAIRTQV
jgi:hypothetical protein